MEFARLVAKYVSPAPHATDQEMLRTLRAAVPRNLTVASEADVEQRVIDAAKDVAHRLHMTRKMTARFDAMCHDPAPARHSVYAGDSDRRAPQDAELSVPLRSSPFFRQFAEEHITPR